MRLRLGHPKSEMLSEAAAAPYAHRICLSTAKIIFRNSNMTGADYPTIFMLRTDPEPAKLQPNQIVDKIEIVTIMVTKVEPTFGIRV